MAILSESTDKIQSQAKPWQFRLGQSGNPSGRPRGSRNKSTLAALPLTVTDLEMIEDMDKPALIALIKRASAANWGLFLKTDAEIRRGLFDMLAIMAMTSTKPGVKLAAIKLLLDRTMGRPARAVQQYAPVKKVIVHSTLRFTGDVDGKPVSASSALTDDE